MNLFGWRIFEDDKPKAPPAPPPTSQPLQSWGQKNSDYYAGKRDRAPSPGVSLVPTVGREKPNNEGLSWWQKVLNTVSGGPGIYNKPGLPEGEVHYYMGNQPVSPLPSGYTASLQQETPVPSPSVARAGVPLPQWNYDQPGVAYGPSPTPVPVVPAQPMPSMAPAPGLPDWGAGAAPVVVPGTGQGPLQAVAPVAPAPVTAAPAPAPAAPLPKFDPALASVPMQRYLKAAGWQGVPTAVPYTGNELIDASTVRLLGPHSYQVPQGLQVQISNDYDVGPLGATKRLEASPVRTAQANAADYAKLTPQQQNAMRFNQLLIAAAEADRQAGVAPEDQSAEYKTWVKDMFGEHGGSEVYAPNTVRLLQRMGMGNLQGQDLDEYLGLDRAYDVNEIKNLKPWDVTPEIAPFTSIGAAAGPETQLALDQRQVDLAGGLITKALGDMGTRGWSEQARINEYLGNRPPVEQIPFGWLKPGEARATDEDNAKEEMFQSMYDYLSMKSTTGLDEFWNAAKSRNFTDADYDEIYDYFYQRSLEDDRAGTDENHRSGAETRKFIGIG